MKRLSWCAYEDAADDMLQGLRELQEHIDYIRSRFKTRHDIQRAFEQCVRDMENDIHNRRDSRGFPTIAPRHLKDLADCLSQL